MSSRKGAWLQTFSGKQFYPLDPRPEDIDIEDIAHALANQCRFAGHARYHYSVAAHSVHVSRLCAPEDAMSGLLHDASEAYLVDVPTPVKGLLYEYAYIETVLMDCIFEKFSLPWGIPDSVHLADRVALATEVRDLMATPPASWGMFAVSPDEKRIEPLVFPGAAKWEFLNRFRELGGKK